MDHGGVDNRTTVVHEGEMLIREMPQTKVRLPPEIKAWLSAQASANRRSLNAEIVMKLEALYAKENARPAATGQALVTQ